MSGSDWPRLVAPAFDSRKAVLFDDRWASARKDLAMIGLMDEDDLEVDWAHLPVTSDGAGQVGCTAGTLHHIQALLHFLHVLPPIPL